MIELAFVACLAAAPSTCRDQVFLYADVTLMLCAVQGQAQLAIRADEHPDWEIRTWRCRMHDPGRKSV